MSRDASPLASRRVYGVDGVQIGVYTRQTDRQTEREMISRWSQARIKVPEAQWQIQAPGLGILGLIPAAASGHILSFWI